MLQPNPLHGAEGVGANPSRHQLRPRHTLTSQGMDVYYPMTCVGSGLNQKLKELLAKTFWRKEATQLDKEINTAVFTQYLEWDEISLRSPMLPSVPRLDKMAEAYPCGKYSFPWSSSDALSSCCSDTQGFPCSPILPCNSTLAPGAMQGLVSMPLSVDAPLIYVRPSISGSIRSPEPKCLSSLLLEALLDKVLLLEWLEFLSPVCNINRDVEWIRGPHSSWRSEDNHYSLFTQVLQNWEWEFSGLTTYKT